MPPTNRDSNWHATTTSELSDLIGSGNSYTDS
jgi:hypothetical protein